MAVPGAIPTTRPTVAPTVATEGVLLVQVPPDGVLVSMVVLPTHTVPAPDIAEGPGVTLTDIVALQPPVE